jgi:hypothetical protein
VDEIERVVIGRYATNLSEIRNPRVETRGYT